MQQLRAAPHHAVPLLAETRQVPGHVDHDHQRHAERVAGAYEPRRFLRARGIEAATEAQWIVGDDADRAAAEPAKGRDDVGCPFGVQFDTGLVEHAVDERVHVVRALGTFGQQR